MFSARNIFWKRLATYRVLLESTPLRWAWAGIGIVAGLWFLLLVPSALHLPPDAVFVPTIAWLTGRGSQAALCLALAVWIGWRNPHATPTAAARRQGEIIRVIAMILVVTVISLMFLEPDLNAHPLIPLHGVVLLVLCTQLLWLEHRGLVGLAGATLIASFVAQGLGVTGSPGLISTIITPFIYTLIVILSGLLVRWWFGLLLAGVLPTLAGLQQALGWTSNAPDWRVTVLTTVLLLTISGVIALYARSLESALLVAEQRSQELATAQHILETQHARLADQAAVLEHQRHTLDQEVQHRTAALKLALDEVRRSAVALHELQSPLVPVADGVLVVPLIGAFDRARAAKFMGNVLDQIEQRHAHTVVADITGLPVLDTLAAQALLQTAGASKLLGARLVLVGVSPAVANTIVSLGVDLRDLQIERDLQTALRTLAFA